MKDPMTPPTRFRRSLRMFDGCAGVVTALIFDQCSGSESVMNGRGLPVHECRMTGLPPARRLVRWRTRIAPFLSGEAY